MRISDWSSDVCSSDLRDAQMQGDRVNTEYYLQFADHYFRVLNENRSRVEEHQRRQRDDQDDDNDVDDDGEEQRADDQRHSYRRPQRSEEPRVGKECVSTCRSVWSASP